MLRRLRSTCTGREWERHLMRTHHVVICSCVQKYQVFIDSLYEMGKRDLLRFKLRVHTAQTSISGASPMNYVVEK